MKLHERVRHTVESQWKEHHATEESRIDAITHLMTIEILAIATQYAYYVVKKGSSVNYSEDFHHFMENEYGKSNL